MDAYQRAKGLLSSQSAHSFIHIATLVKQAIRADQVLVLKPVKVIGDQPEILWSEPPADETISTQTSCSEADVLQNDTIGQLAVSQRKDEKPSVKYFNDGYLWDRSEIGSAVVQAIRLEAAIDYGVVVFLWIRHCEKPFTAKCCDAFEGLVPCLPGVRSEEVGNQRKPALRPPVLVGDLSPTENKVLTLLIKGFTERAIAEEMGRSRNTIHVHVRNIYRHFLVHSRAELLQYARSLHATT